MVSEILEYAAQNGFWTTSSILAMAGGNFYLVVVLIDQQSCL
jgi:hypothetical protein